MKPTNKRAIVIGGSLGGLFTGIMLHSIGWEVDIYERSARTLDSRGGGIVLQPDVVEAFQRVGVPYEEPLGVVAHERYYLKRDGSIAQRMPIRQTLTSWNLLYGSMRRHFPSEHYHTGKRLTDIQQEGERVTALVGDAAFIPRPHTAASTSKAAANALALADALIERDRNVPQALHAWELPQLADGVRLMQYGQTLGDRSQFMYGTGRAA